MAALLQRSSGKSRWRALAIMPRINSGSSLFPSLFLSGALSACGVLALSACGDGPDAEKAVGSTSTGTLSGTSSLGTGTNSSPTGIPSGSTSNSVTTSSGAGSSSTGPNPDQTSTSSTSSSSSSSSGTGEPDFLWLENPKDPRLSKWIKETNAKSKPALEAQPGFADIRAKILEMVNAEPTNQLPAFSKIGDYVYSFLRNPANPLGLWRRQSYADFQAKKEEWDPLLSVDAIAAAQKQPWAWLGPNCLAPAGDRCMVNLQKPGQAVGVTLEFDTNTKAFVTENRFDLPPESLTQVSWIDADNLYVSANFGPGTTTNSGQPRTVRKLTRGAPLKDAPVIFEVQPTDAYVKVSSIKTGGFTRVLAIRGVKANQQEFFLLDATNHKPTKLDVPADATVGFWGSWMILQLGDKDWSVGGQTWEGGSVLVVDEAAFIGGNREFKRLFTPGPRTQLSSMETVKDHILIGAMENNKGRVYEWSYSEGAGWVQRAAQMPKFGNFMVEAVSHDTSNEYFLTYTDFLTPATMYVATAGNNERSVLRETKASFDATGLEVQQFFAKSKDGTKVPYFQISKQGLELNGKNPTIVFGFGGFNVSLMPGYRAGVGLGWLEKGGVYVLANIRGGGEFGPSWHQAALKANRQRSFDDFIAVGEDLVARKVSSKAHMGVHGDGNGGLVAGVMMTQRPDLWGAVVSQNPILDMQRFHVIPGGASWITEFGNPGRAQDLSYLLKYSPFHQVNAKTVYPPLFLSSRSVNPQVSPAHARKMMAKMMHQGHQNVVFYESTALTEQGGASPAERRAYNAALIFSFFAKHLGLAK